MTCTNCRQGLAESTGVSMHCGAQQVGSVPRNTSTLRGSCYPSSFPKLSAYRRSTAQSLLVRGVHNLSSALVRFHPVKNDGG